MGTRLSLRCAAALVLCCAFCLSVSALAPAAAASTIYVDDDCGCPLPDGTPECPYCHIQDAVDVAVTGDTVVVLPGTYPENLDFLGKGITVTSTDPLDPAVVAATVIDGSGAGSVVTFAAGEGADSVLQGFTITHGSGSLNHGAGIYCTGASPTITNNVITENDAGYRNGGGIACVSGSSPLIAANTIIGNTGDHGGGLCCSSVSSPTIANNVIAGNSSPQSNGGGIYCQSSSPTIAGNTITDNTAGSGGGGIYCSSFSSPGLINNVIAHNSATYFGGGVRCYNSSSPTITNCTFADNAGGGIATRTNSPLTITNCIVWDDIAADETSPVDATYSDTQGPWPGEGNISLDPQFVAPASDDYHLGPESPCIEAGLNASAPADDIDGDARPWPSDGVADMGADEWVPCCDIVYDPPLPSTGEVITFYSCAAAPGGESLPVTWDFGDGSAATGDPATHQYPMPGTYTVAATVCGSSGLLCRTCTAMVTVLDTMPPTITQCASDQTLSADANCQAAIPDLTGEVVATDNCDGSLDITQSPTAGTLVGLGSHTVTLTVTDDAGNDATCTATVTVTDDTAPTISQCASDQMLSADANCQAAIPDLTGEVVATDNCDGSLDVTQSPAAGTLVGLGSHTVTLTVTDDPGNDATCTTTVTVTDDIPPTITQCASDQTLSADADCQAAIPDLTGEVVATDNCDGSLDVTQSPAAGTLVGLGSHTVTLTVTDDAGNDATCTATVSVLDDTPPTITQCASDQTLSADADCQAAIPDLTGEVVATDNCDDVLEVTQSPTAGTLVGLGDHIVTLTVTDDAGNEATCTATVSVLDDTAPTITQCAQDQTLSADADCQAAIPDLTGGVVATDNCDASLDITQSPAAGTLVGLGSHTVTLTVADDAGNDATCTATVSVLDDTPPTITQCAQDRTLSADANCQAAIPDLTGEVVATDNCDDLLDVTQSPTAGTLVALGSHTVTLTVADDAGNDATCTATVTVTDDTPPTITQCASDQTLSADANCQGAIPDLTGEVVATDNCDASLDITQSPTAGTLVGLGSYTVTLTAADDAGNDATCTATVSVLNDTPPTITQCASDQTLSADADCQAAIPHLTGEVVATDNCDDVLDVTQSPTAGTLVGLGSHTVTLTITDDAGNDATCTATVTVTDDVAPTITQCASDQTLSADADCQAAIPDLTGEVVATDNCDGSLDVTQSPAAGTLVGLGSHTVTLTVADDAGNQATCTATITVDTIQVSLPLTELGWHMISLPLEPVNKNILLDRGTDLVDPDSIFYDSYVAGNDPQGRLYRYQPGVGYWVYNPLILLEQAWYEVGVEPPPGKPHPGSWWQGFWYLVDVPHTLTYAAYPLPTEPMVRFLDISSAPMEWAWVMIGACGHVLDPYQPDVTTWPATSIATDLVWGSSAPPTEPTTWLPTSDCSGPDAWHQGYFGLPLSGYLIGERYYFVSPPVAQYCGVPADTDALRPGEAYWLDIEDPTVWLQVLPGP